MGKSINWFPTGTGIPNALSTASSMVSGDYTALPVNLQSMPGIAGFVGSSCRKPLPGPEVTTLGIVYALRTDGTTTKAYGYTYGINAGGTHVMGGNNFKAHPHHHVTSPNFNWSLMFGTSPDGTPW
jgi:hypothetical protein